MEPLAEKIGRHVAEVWGDSIRAERVVSLAGDASSRQYFRVFLSSPSSPETIIVMKIADRGLALSSEELARFQEPLTELPFVNVRRFFSSIGIHVPEIYADFTHDGLLFLQDLGDRTLWEQVRGAPREEILNWYRRAIDELLLIQLRGTAKNDPSCIAFRQTFDRTLYLWEFEHFVEHALEQGVPDSLPRGLRKLLEERFSAIAFELDEVSKVLNHRDFHSWNLLVHDGQVWVIDFQDALMAPPQYDLASLLNDRDSPEIITPAIEQKLIDHYLEGWRALEGHRWNREHFLRVYTLSALQRDLKVIGRFHYLENVKGKKGYLRFLPGVIRRARKHLEELPDQRPLLRALEEPFDELTERLSR